jgi:two-component system chemotaxis response regulator CheY
LNEVTNSKPQVVLLVEDDEDIRDAIREALEIEGYQIEVVCDGKEALDRLTDGPLPSLILLDLMLPFVSGWEIIDIIRKNRGAPIASVPIVITSAAGDSALVAAQSVEGHLKKPIDLGQLLDTVARYCQPARAV